MCGVDLSDQRVGTYRRHMKFCTWYLQVFFHFLNLCVVQSFLIYKSLHTGTKMTLQFISALIGGRTYTHKRGRRTSNVPDHPAKPRWNRDLVHAPEMFSTQSIGTDMTYHFSVDVPLRI